MVVQNEMLPVHHQGIETPGSGTKKVQQLRIADCIEVPKATEGVDALDVVAADEAEDDHTE